MHFGFVKLAPARVFLSGAALLLLAVVPAYGQHPLFGGPRSDYCPPPPCLPAPAPEAKPPTPGVPGQPPPAEAEPSVSTERFGAAPTEMVAVMTPNMQGDQLGVPAITFTPRSANGEIVLVPSIRKFKIAEDENPRPVDRVYFGFNFYDHVNKSVDDRLGIFPEHLRVYRETFGLEKTFLDQNASIGLRLHLNTLEADSTVPGLDTSHTDVGDLMVILKYAFCQNRQTGSLLSGGLAITTPTGPDAFADSRLSNNIHSTSLQPYVGYIWVADNLYVQGFSSIDVPTESRDVTILYNDIGIGYYIYRNRDNCRLLSGIVPTFEVHVNTPLNHRGAFNFSDPTGTPDWVDFTYGINFEVHRRSTFGVGFVTPVTGPKPFDYEVLAQLNLRF